MAQAMSGSFTTEISSLVKSMSGSPGLFSSQCGLMWVSPLAGASGARASALTYVGKGQKTVQFRLAAGTPKGEADRSRHSYRPGRRCRGAPAGLSRQSNSQPTAPLCGINTGGLALPEQGVRLPVSVPL